MAACLLLGYFVDTSAVAGEPDVRQQIDAIIASIGGLSNLFFNLLNKVFWSEVLRLVWALGVELWIGSFIIGAACALPSYVISRWLITSYRQRFPRPKLFQKAARRLAAKRQLRGAKPQLRKPQA